MPKPEVQNDSSSDYEEVEVERSTLKAQTLPSKMQPSCMKSSKIMTTLQLCVMI